MQLDEKTLEADTRRLAHEIHRRARAASRLLRPSMLQERLMQRFMADPAVRVGLLRFVDAYPALTTPAEVARHFAEYLGGCGAALPPMLRLGHAMAAGRAAGRLGAGVAAGAVAVAIGRMARKYICGQDSAEAIATVRRFARRGMLFTIDMLGEEVLSDREADEYVSRYLGLMEDLHAAERGMRRASAGVDCGPAVNLSLKLSAMDPQFDPVAPQETARKVLPRLLRIFLRARELGAFVNVDIEQYERRDLAVHLFLTAAGNSRLRDYPHLGIVAQAYLRDARPAIRRLIEAAGWRGTPFTVRLVKGAYWDYEVIHARQQNHPVPVFTNKEETDANCEWMLRDLLAAWPTVRTATGSHNVRTVAHALALREMLGVDPAGYEAQTLYGMGDPIRHALAAMGVPGRVYMPYGPLVPGMGYLVRRLLENTANESFLKGEFYTGTAEEILFHDPKPAFAAAA